MTAGDIYSSMSNTGRVSVIPAGATKVMITFIGGSENAILQGDQGGVSNFDINGPNGSGSNVPQYCKWNGGGLTNMRLFINSTNYISFRSGTGTSYYAYSGIEI